MVQRDWIDSGVDAAAGQQCGKRRREPDTRRVLGDVERLDAEPIASEQHPSAVAFDDREREHAEEAVDETVAPVVVGLEQHLGVAVGEEPVAVLAQLAAQLLVVVDAAVPRNGQPEVGVDHRLRAGFGQIDDFQATMTKRDPALRPHACGVGTPRLHGLGHRRDRGDVRGNGRRVAPRRWLRTPVRPYFCVGALNRATWPCDRRGAVVNYPGNAATPPGIKIETIVTITSSR